MKKYIFLLVFLGALGSAQKVFSLPQDTLYWNADYKLDWSDFKSKPDTLSKYGAISNIVLKYHLSASEKAFNVNVLCFFIKTKSWSRFKNNDTLLLHEQGHFDIAEIFARRLRKALVKCEFNYTTIGKDVHNLFLINKTEKDKMDRLYDKETDLSRNGGMQLIWSKRIKAELEKLQAYKQK